jgi:aryl-alcohol dehydrogenase-like predicted oxidoreductase
MTMTDSSDVGQFEIGVQLIDTADSYGRGIAGELIRQTLHPYGRDW